VGVTHAGFVADTPNKSCRLHTGAATPKLRRMYFA
jgi:hypothetical protein